MRKLKLWRREGKNDGGEVIENQIWAANKKIFVFFRLVCLSAGLLFQPENGG
ncbi:MAG: hypothetical protein HQL67_03020 [Magnetococcales bacterium]|nr:hypothetical protein [Magnetococcales bacterium]